MPITPATSGFIGRGDVLDLFRKDILECGQPAYNILSIHGEAGVGKTTLLHYLKSMADSHQFNHVCVTALVDYVPSTPASVSLMKQVADQFAAAGHPLEAFKKAFVAYVDDLHKISVQPDTTDERIIQDVEKVATTAGGMAPGPLGRAVGGVVAPVIDLAGTLFKKKEDELRNQQEADRLYDAIGALTQAFVDDLNSLAENRSWIESDYTNPQRLVILFLDAFEHIAADVSPWLLNYFLSTIVSQEKMAARDHVVLVIASRKPIETATDTTELSGWQVYSQRIFPIPLNRFTLEETGRYLKKRGITDAATVVEIQELTEGLPYDLSLVKLDPHGKIDLTGGLLDAYLHSIPKAANDKGENDLAIHVALMSRPFNQDDLKAFPLLAPQDIPGLYKWLTDLPFVHRNQDGRYRYHDLARKGFSLHLYQTSPDEYCEVRGKLADYYSKELQQIEQQQGQQVYQSPAWLELVRAFVFQAFLLPDAQSHLEAVRSIINAYVRVKQSEAVAHILSEFSKDYADDPANTVQQLVANLSVTLTAKLTDQEFLDAHTYLLHQLDEVPETVFPKILLAHIYYRRGLSYLSLRHNDQAIADFTHAIALDADDSRKYGSRGLAFRLTKNYPTALQDFDQAIKLQPDYAWAYAERALVHRHLKNYNEALNDLSKAIELEPTSAWAYGQRGKTQRLLKNYPQALADLEQAITLDPKNSWALSQKGLTYLWLKDTDSAYAAYNHSWELMPTYLYNEWMGEWAAMCKVRPNAQTLVRLEKLVADDTNSTVLACRGTLLWLNRNFEQALIELEQAMALHPERWDLPFWCGMTFASLGRNDEAVAALEKALTLGLPPVLLAPLRWLEQDKADFYQQYARPILARYG